MRSCCGSSCELIESTFPLTIARAPIINSSSEGMVKVLENAEPVSAIRIEANAIANAPALFQVLLMKPPVRMGRNEKMRLIDERRARLNQSCGAKRDGLPQ